jgi:hypothetical protein
MRLDLYLDLCDSLYDDYLVDLAMTREEKTNCLLYSLDSMATGFFRWASDGIRHGATRLHRKPVTEMGSLKPKATVLGAVGGSAITVTAEESLQLPRGQREAQVS